MKARLINCALPCKDLPVSIKFYEALLGETLGRSLSEFEAYYAWASAGVKLTVNSPTWKGTAPMLTFAVENLEEARDELEAAGGKILEKEIPLPVPKEIFGAYSQRFEQVGLGKATEVTDRLGVMALFKDPAGTVIGLIQLDKYAEAFFVEGTVSSREANLHDAEVVYWMNAFRRDS